MTEIVSPAWVLHPTGLDDGEKVWLIGRFASASPVKCRPLAII